MMDWESKLAHLAGLPHPIVYLHNVRAQPLGDGNLRLLIVDHPYHAACWDVLEEHGIGREVVLILDGDEYLYQAEIGDDEAVYLIPNQGENEKLPDNDRFLRKAFNLRLRW